MLFVLIVFIVYFVFTCVLLLWRCDWLRAFSLRCCLIDVWLFDVCIVINSVVMEFPTFVYYFVTSL